MSTDRTILVTGAGGFIGGQIVEILHTLEIGEVRAGVRRWASGARIGRLPVDIVQCDIRKPDHLRAALEGVTHVVHCAVGDPETTIDGTRKLLKAAAEGGVQRFVHLSTIDVYGSPTGHVDEQHPLTHTGREYGDMKIAAEKVCREFASKGLHVTILRPTLVHGPFSAAWTVGYVERLKKRPWLIVPEDAEGTCNLVYVDDLVGAVIASFDTESGEAFNVNGPDRVTWHEYFTALNDAAGFGALRTAPWSRWRPCFAGFPCPASSSSTAKRCGTTRARRSSSSGSSPGSLCPKLSCSPVPGSITMGTPTASGRRRALP